MENETKEIIEIKNQIAQNLLFKGDISGLKSEQKWQYYQFIRERLKLDPLTQPFQIIKFISQGNKEVLYCTKGGAEQLAENQKVSCEKLDEKIENDLKIVSYRASLPDGRFVDDIGIVDISNKRGNELANLIMKAHTKAKRRATLSLLGLGMLDETEIETIPNVKSVNIQGVDNSATPIAERVAGDKPAPITQPLFCSHCETQISGKVASYSSERYGKLLCWDCQQEERKFKETGEHQEQTELEEMI